MIYLPFTLFSTAQSVATALWDLTCPVATRNPANVTVSYGAVTQDAEGDWFLCLPDAAALTVNSIDEETLERLLSFYEIEIGALVEELREEFKQSIRDVLGTTVAVLNLMPESLQSMAVNQISQIDFNTFVP
jgi:hypothetical protein